MSFATIKTALAAFFGSEEHKAHALIEAVVTDAAPLLADFKAQVAQLIAEGHADAAKLVAEALTDLKADIAAVKDAVTPATVTAAAAAPDVPPAGPVTPATT